MLTKIKCDKHETASEIYKMLNRGGEFSEILSVDKIKLTNIHNKTAKIIQYYYVYSK